MRVWAHIFWSEDEKGKGVINENNFQIQKNRIKKKSIVLYGVIRFKGGGGYCFSSSILDAKRAEVRVEPKPHWEPSRHHEGSVYKSLRNPIALALLNCQYASIWRARAAIDGSSWPFPAGIKRNRHHHPVEAMLAAVQLAQLLMRQHTKGAAPGWKSNAPARTLILSHYY